VNGWGKLHLARARQYDLVLAFHRLVPNSAISIEYFWNMAIRLLVNSAMTLRISTGDLAIGVIAGFLFDRLAGPSWLARQFSGSTRGMITSALVGVAGAFVGYHIGGLLALSGGE
jgi:uncharacterized membrane protein YeaQ/YmgE (transglycosylase-associated protein family)